MQDISHHCTWMGGEGESEQSEEFSLGLFSKKKQLRCSQVQFRRAFSGDLCSSDPSIGSERSRAAEKCERATLEKRSLTQIASNQKVLWLVVLKSKREAHSNESDISVTRVKYCSTMKATCRSCDCMHMLKVKLKHICEKHMCTISIWK